MAIVLKLDSVPSAFEPVEVEVDGVVLRVRELTLTDLRKIQALTPDLMAGSADALDKILSLVLEGDTKVLEKLQLAKVRKLVDVVLERGLKPVAEEKN